MSEGNGNGQQPQPVMMMPPVTYGIGETPDRKNVIVQFQTIYGVQTYPFDPNAALTFARQVRAKAKELNTGVAIARAPLLGPNGQVLSVVAAEDDEDEPSGDVVAP